MSFGCVCFEYRVVGFVVVYCVEVVDGCGVVCCIEEVVGLLIVVVVCWCFFDDEYFCFCVVGFDGGVGFGDFEVSDEYVDVDGGYVCILYVVVIILIFWDCLNCIDEFGIWIIMDCSCFVLLVVGYMFSMSSNYVEYWGWMREWGLIDVCWWWVELLVYFGCCWVCFCEEGVGGKCCWNCCGCGSDVVYFVLLFWG